MDDNKLDIIGKLSAALDKNSVPRAEFERLVERLFSALAKREDKLKADFQAIKEAVDNLSRQVSEKTDLTAAEVREIARKAAEDVNRTLDAQVTKVDLKLDQVMDGRDGQDADEERVIQEVLARIQLPEQKEVILDGPKELRAKLADDLKPIQELKAELDKLKQSVSNIPRGPLSGRYVNTPMVDTFTGDGSTKEFYLEKQPKDLSKVLLHGRDFPYVLMHGDGFTISGKLLTIATDFDAPTNNFVVSYSI